MTLGTLTMRRAGDFSVRAVGPNHCGTSEDLSVRYEVFVRCSDQLDSRGFLFDQLTVAKFFASIRRTELSCEELAANCGRKLIELIHHENPNCVILSLRVMLSPEPYAASMTFSCHPALEERRRQRQPAGEAAAHLDRLMREAQTVV